MDEAASSVVAPAGPVQRPLLYFAMWQRMPALEKAELLASWGYDVRLDYSYNKGELNAAVGRLLALKPAVLVLSLDEFPGYTRSLALGLQAKSGLRSIPRICVGGEETQVAQLAQALPELQHCQWEGLRELLTEVLGAAPPPADAEPAPVVRAFN